MDLAFAVHAFTVDKQCRLNVRNMCINKANFLEGCRAMGVLEEREHGRKVKANVV
jgi:hypothetical protein